MAKKRDSDKSGFVFSTNRDFKFNDNEPKEPDTLEPAQQQLRIRLDTKHRGGKTVTLISGFVGYDSDLQTLGRSLKNACGTGGSAKDGSIIIQGDHRETVLPWLLKNGYKLTKKL
ncbi:MAG TPA: translation initiation factor [Chitinophagaceae bacterium]|nr:translation initiation factor [Chitinophagaceae bacterium]